jgi:AmmeMemoRadiSam system protein A
VASIEHGLRHRKPLTVDPSSYTERLRANQSCFVTLLKHGQLRGCMGSLKPTRTLIEDVTANAYAAAFKDPRFRSVGAEERTELATHVSVLSPHTSLEFTSHADLMGQLRPGLDGIIIAHQGLQATFLPSVWRSLPDPEQFILHLRRKAHISDGVPTSALSVWRYLVEEFGDDDREDGAR